MPRKTTRKLGRRVRTARRKRFCRTADKRKRMANAWNGKMDGLPVPEEIESLILHLLPPAYKVVAMFVNRRWSLALRDSRIGGERSLCALLARKGDLPTPRWAKERIGFAWDWRTTSQACKRGDVEMLRYLHENNGCYLGIGGHVLRDAASNGHMEAIKYLRSLGGDNYIVTYDAARGGHLELLKWACAEGFWCLYDVPHGCCIRWALRGAGVAAVAAQMLLERAQCCVRGCEAGRPSNARPRFIESATGPRSCSTRRSPTSEL